MIKRPTRSALRSRVLASVTFAALATLVVGCGGDDEDESSPSDSTPATATSTTSAPEDAAASQAADAVEGRWETAPISRSAVETTLGAVGLSQWIEQWIGLSDFQDFREDAVVTLSLEQGRWTAEVAVGDDPPQVADAGSFSVEGDTVLYTPNSGGVNTYRWMIDGDQLELEFISTTEPDFAGIPNEVFQRALYTVSPFQRAAP